MKHHLVWVKIKRDLPDVLPITSTRCIYRLHDVKSSYRKQTKTKNKHTQN